MASRQQGDAVRRSTVLAIPLLRIKKRSSIDDPSLKAAKQTAIDASRRSPRQLRPGHPGEAV